MTTLSKDEVKKLTPEQQEAVARMEAQRIRVRQEILERARRYCGMNVVAGLVMGAAGGLAIFGVVYPPALMFAVIATMALTVRLAAGLHQRLDALLDLLDHDIKNGGRKDDDHAT